MKTHPFGTGRLKCAAGIVVAGLVLSACAAEEPTAADGGTNGDSETTQSDGTLNVGMAVAPTTIDPASACTLDDNQLAYQLYAQLLEYGTQTNDDGVSEVDPTTVEPYLAHDWEVNDDADVYTFYLEEGWTFPSGEPVDAEAVKYSMERTNAINGCGAAIINNLYTEPFLIEEIVVVDDHTVEFNLSRSDVDFPLAMATASASIVDPSLVEENGGVEDNTPNEWMDSNEAGSGPFRLESYEPGNQAVLVADENFQGEAPGSEQINVSWIDSDSAMTLQLQNGDIDIAMGLTKNSAASFEDEEGFELAANVATANMQLLTPMDTEPWDDVLVREAVTHAIPYEDILDNVLQGYGELYYGPIQPTMPGFDESLSAPRDYDPDYAQELIDESGLDTPVTVDLDIISGNPTHEDLGTIIQGALSEIGIEVNVNALSESAWNDAVYNGTTQMALRLDGPAIFSAGYYLQYDEYCSSPHNTGRVCVEGNEELLDSARSATDEDERDEYLSQLTENWIEESPKTILYLDANAVVHREGVHYHYDMVTNMRDWAPAE
ncbi:ABC transporter substrate-binding protein [Nesterenkonia alba]|uniref:ABC transporter substrate-binding protein n=1 Tax=Nesterenkonia alba TaxID=515814 RepID=UPI0003B7B6CF|nr:ABC transporter substrate-binding protein [Nesterenkonia alba]